MWKQYPRKMCEDPHGSSFKESWIGCSEMPIGKIKKIIYNSEFVLLSYLLVSIRAWFSVSSQGTD